MAFRSGRRGGAAYDSDHSGSLHARAVRLSAMALAPLGVLALWYIVGAVGKSYEGVRAELARPFPAIVLLAFACVAVYHMRLGMNEIIEDYVHDETFRTAALLVNKWLSLAIGAVWVLSIMIFAAAR